MVKYTDLDTGRVAYLEAEDIAIMATGESDISLKRNTDKIAVTLQCTKKLDNLAGAGVDINRLREMEEQ